MRVVLEYCINNDFEYSLFNSLFDEPFSAQPVRRFTVNDYQNDSPLRDDDVLQ